MFDKNIFSELAYKFQKIGDLKPDDVKTNFRFFGNIVTDDVVYKINPTRYRFYIQFMTALNDPEKLKKIMYENKLLKHSKEEEAEIINGITKKLNELYTLPSNIDKHILGNDELYTKYKNEFVRNEKRALIKKMTNMMKAYADDDVVNKKELISIMEDTFNKDEVEEQSGGKQKGRGANDQLALRAPTQSSNGSSTMRVSQPDGEFVSPPFGSQTFDEGQQSVMSSLPSTLGISNASNQEVSPYTNNQNYPTDQSQINIQNSSPLPSSFGPGQAVGPYKNGLNGELIPFPLPNKDNDAYAQSSFEIQDPPQPQTNQPDTPIKQEDTSDPYNTPNDPYNDIAALASIPAVQQPSQITAPDNNFKDQVVDVQPPVDDVEYVEPQYETQAENKNAYDATKSALKKNKNDIENASIRADRDKERYKSNIGKIREKFKNDSVLHNYRDKLKFVLDAPSANNRIKASKLNDILVDMDSNEITSIDNLKVSKEDVLVFIGITFIIRMVALVFVDWSMNTNFVVSYAQAYFLYFAIYSIILLILIVVVNITYKYPYYSLFMNNHNIFTTMASGLYYFYIKPGYFMPSIFRFILHLGIIVGITIPFVVIKEMETKRSGNDDDRLQYDYAQKKNIRKSLNNFTLIIWLFTALIAFKVK